MEPPSVPNTATAFPSLEILDQDVSHNFIRPAKQINDGPDVERFLKSKAYRDIGFFVMQLNRAMCPRKLKDSEGNDKTESFQLGSTLETHPAESVRKIQQMLSTVESYIDEAPPDPGPRRFGNISFRKWHALLEERVIDILQGHVADSILGRGDDIQGQQGANASDELTAYFLGSFGSAQRLDYGTGHELSFLAFLGCLWKLGAFKDGQANGELERNIVLGAFEPYLRVVRRLILTYTLEPAGSHGVWGLDDHSFQPYIYGSAQLTRPIFESEAMPLEGSLTGRDTPKPGDVVKADKVERLRSRNMYFSAIGFINDVKKGPFWEHSPILFDISGIRDGWGKINKGMIKMFNAEVLSKFPVVQHFPFGSLFSWEEDPNAALPQHSIHLANQPIAAATAASATRAPGASVGTGAPWAQAVSNAPSGPGIPYSNVRAPWASGQPGTRPPQPAAPQVRPEEAHRSSTRAPWAPSSDRSTGQHGI